MLQCEECEHFHRGENGEIRLSCDPFSTVKEPACLLKWQLLKINQMVAGYQATLNYYRRLAPMQEKMFRAMEREIDEMNEGDKWKLDEDDEDEHDEDRPDWDTDEPDALNA